MLCQSQVPWGIRLSRYVWEEPCGSNLLLSKKYFQHSKHKYLFVIPLFFLFLVIFSFCNRWCLPLMIIFHMPLFILNMNKIFTNRTLCFIMILLHMNIMFISCIKHFFAMTTLVSFLYWTYFLCLLKLNLVVNFFSHSLHSAT